MDHSKCSHALLPACQAPCMRMGTGMQACSCSHGCKSQAWTLHGCSHREWHAPVPRLPRAEVPIMIPLSVNFGRCAGPSSSGSHGPPHDAAMPGAAAAAAAAAAGSVASAGPGSGSSAPSSVPALVLGEVFLPCRALMGLAAGQPQPQPYSGAGMASMDPMSGLLLSAALSINDTTLTFVTRDAAEAVRKALVVQR